LRLENETLRASPTAMAELEELEERNRALQAALDRITAAEQEAKAEREFLDAKAETVRQELAAARSRNERAAQIRNTCKRLTCLEGKLHPVGARDNAQAHPGLCPALFTPAVSFLDQADSLVPISRFGDSRQAG